MIVTPFATAPSIRFVRPRFTPYPFDRSMILADSGSALKERFDSSMWFLVGANLLPLVGVLFWDWSLFELVALYWLENVLIGAINILKMVTNSPDPAVLEETLEERVRAQRKAGVSLTRAEKREMAQAKEVIEDLQKSGGMLNHGIKVFLIPFFTFHYGMFCLVHGVFVFALLGGGSDAGVFFNGGPFGMISHLIGRAVAAGGFWAVLALAGSHLYSFVSNYLGKGEFRRTAVPLLMMAPYGRIVVLHLAILFGAFAIMALGSPLFLLILLIAGKIALDLKLHRRSHQKIAPESQTA
jgi:hypothetical protein